MWREDRKIHDVAGPPQWREAQNVGGFRGPMEAGKTKLSKNKLDLIDAMVIASPHMAQIGS